ncbi:MAG: hypothetical protein U0165_02680 [Polyangiaceae bacterium]
MPPPYHSRGLDPASLAAGWGRYAFVRLPETAEGAPTSPTERRAIHGEAPTGFRSR